MMWMKWPISRAMGVSPVSKPNRICSINQKCVWANIDLTRSEIRDPTHHRPIARFNDHPQTRAWEQRQGGGTVLEVILSNEPSTANVLKKAKFFVSSGLSLVNSGPRDCGSDSPVNEELSTLKPCALMIRTSAGTRSPNFTSTRSPTTSSSAFKLRFSPFRMANAC